MMNKVLDFCLKVWADAKGYTLLEHPHKPYQGLNGWMVGDDWDRAPNRGYVPPIDLDFCNSLSTKHIEVEYFHALSKALDVLYGPGTEPITYVDMMKLHQATVGQRLQAYYDACNSY